MRFRYSRSVIELLAAFPGREWRMCQVVRHVARGRVLGKPERERLRKGVRRALEALIEARVVQKKPGRRGGATLYRWRPVAGADAMRDNGAAEVASAVSVQAASGAR